MNTRLMLTLACTAVLAACSSADSAAPPVVDTVTWTMPVQFTDNTAIPAGAIAKSTVVWGPSGGPYPNTQDVTAPATTLALTRAGDGYGTRCYKVNVTTTAAYGSAAGLYSDPERCKTVQAPPKEPTGVTVQ